MAAAAICGIPLATLHTIVAPAFAINSTVVCPAGELVRGTGGLIAGSNGDIVFEGIVPDMGLNSVRVTARDSAGGLRPTRAYAVCA